MSLNKPNQQLRRDLKEAAALLKWSGVDLFIFAKRLLAAGDEQGANDLMKIALSFQGFEDKLADDTRAKGTAFGGDEIPFAPEVR